MRKSGLHSLVLQEMVTRLPIANARFIYKEKKMRNFAIWVSVYIKPPGHRLAQDKALAMINREWLIVNAVGSRSTRAPSLGADLGEMFFTTRTETGRFSHQEVVPSGGGPAVTKSKGRFLGPCLQALGRR